MDPLVVPRFNLLILSLLQRDLDATSQHVGPWQRNHPMNLTSWLRHKYLSSVIYLMKDKVSLYLNNNEDTLIRAKLQHAATQ